MMNNSEHKIRYRKTDACQFFGILSMFHVYELLLLFEVNAHAFKLRNYWMDIVIGVHNLNNLRDTSPLD